MVFFRQKQIALAFRNSTMVCHLRFKNSKNKIFSQHNVWKLRWRCVGLSLLNNTLELNETNDDLILRNQLDDLSTTRLTCDSLFLHRSMCIFHLHIFHFLTFGLLFHLRTTTADTLYCSIHFIVDYPLWTLVLQYSFQNKSTIWSII